ncbi:MAG: hypothetical protein Q4G23_12140, partial [Clostridia bacterium]|nr:hypothetical protein [Clostridia bacterium]
KTQWYGGETFPVVDMRWIDKQYYFDLMKYAGLPTNQDAMDDSFITSSNFWSAKTAKHNYFTVEDESDNMFEIFRNFATRSKEQGFINVISQSYMLKDYMAYNADMFETDAKAIPCIVADYVRTGRNTILRLILMMSTFPVAITTLIKELALMGIKVYDLKKQLWYEIYRCYADVEALSLLPEDYKEAVEAASELFLSRFIEKGIKIGIDLINEKDVYNAKLGKIEHTYFISNQEFMDTCVYELKSAGYITEDEKGDENYLGSELSGHIYQKYLPGQFFTFSGKYYEMRYLTADNHVLVRRAADHITGRPTYRQIREYILTGSKLSDGIGACQDVSGMKIMHEYADIKVNTPGYYKMNKYEDFATAKEVLFEGEKSGIPQRRYYNKEILRIDLPDAEGKFNDSVRYTITTLLNEVFKTIFAENSHYIVAVTDESFAEKKEYKPLTYSIDAEGTVLNKNSIYIIEDSQLDLGLMVAVERNWQRILGIITDYLNWHMDTLELSLNPPEEPKPPVKFEEPAENTEEEPKPEKKKGFIRRLIDKIKNLFKRKKKKGKEEEAENPVDPADEISVVPEGENPDEPEGETPVEPADETTGEPAEGEAVPAEPAENTEEEPK